MRQGISYNLKWYLEYLAYLLFRAVFSRIPLKVLLKGADILGCCLFYIFRIRRDVTIANLGYAFGEGHRGMPVKRIARLSYAHILKTLSELIHIKQIIAHMGLFVDIRHIQLFHEALKGGRGAILATGHFGNFELGALALARAGMPVSIVVKPLRNPYIDRELSWLRNSLGAEIITIDNAGRGILKALRHNRIVCLLSDQDVGLSRGTLVKFFGHDTSTPTGAARIALGARVPLIPSFIHRKGDGTHVLDIGPPIKIEYLKRHQNNEIKRITQQFTLALEKQVSLNPDQYFWLHRRWKSTDGGRGLYRRR